MKTDGFHSIFEASGIFKEGMIVVAQKLLFTSCGLKKKKKEEKAAKGGGKKEETHSKAAQMCIPLQEKTESLCVYYECKQLFSPLARRLFFFLCIVICVLVLLFVSLLLFFFFSLSLLFCEALLSPSLMRVSRASVSNISFCLKVSSGTCDGSQNGYGTEQ